MTALAGKFIPVESVEVAQIRRIIPSLYPRSTISLSSGVKPE